MSSHHIGQQKSEAHACLCFLTVNITYTKLKILFECSDYTSSGVFFICLKCKFLQGGILAYNVKPYIITNLHKKIEQLLFLSNFSLITVFKASARGIKFIKGHYHLVQG